MEDIAFNDWPGQPVDFGVSGANSWLPAYGFHPPTALLERDDFLGNPDAEYFLQGTSTPCLYLETIHEETSDDLRSDSSDISDLRESPLGWLATDSETDSVICMDALNGDTDCESDREIACPIKRRRQDITIGFLAPPSLDDDYQSLSRSSSLIQFETLEKQCQAETCSTSTPSIYKCLEDVDDDDDKTTVSRSISGSDSSDTGDSEVTLLSPDKSLKTWRSFDSLIPSKSNSKISAENLSEDSGYSDHLYTRKSSLRKISGVVKNFHAYDAYCDSFQTRITANIGASCQNLSVFEEEERFDAAINLEKSSLQTTTTTQCRRDISKYNCTSASEPNLQEHHAKAERHNFFCAATAATAIFSVPKNLDLIASSVNHHQHESIAEKNWDLTTLNHKNYNNNSDSCSNNNIDMAESVNFKREGSYAEAMKDNNRVDLSDDEHSLRFNSAKKKLPKNPIVEFDKKILHVISESINSINSKSIADNYLDDVYNNISNNKYQTNNNNNKRNVASTPNLATDNLIGNFFSYNDFPSDNNNRRSVQELPRKSSLMNTSTSTSYLSDFEDNATAKLSTFNSDLSNSSKGVHFSPVVSEVNWRDKESPSSSTLERESSSCSSSSDRVNALARALLMESPPRSKRLGGSQPDLGRPLPRDRKISLSQPDVSNRSKRRGSQLIKRDGDGCIVKAYIDGDGFQYKHTHLDVDGDAPSTTANKSHVDGVRSAASGLNIAAVAGMEALDASRNEEKCAKQRSGKLGGFFARLTSFRFSNRKDHKKKKNNATNTNDNKKNTVVAAPLPHQKTASKEDYIYIPLKGPSSGTASSHQQPTRTASINNNNHVDQPAPWAPTSSRPPLPRAPPRVVGASVKSARDQQQPHPQPPFGQQQPPSHRRRRTIDSGESCPRPMEPMGLIETDLDTDVTVITSGPNVKTRSLLNLGAEPRLLGAKENRHLHRSRGNDDGDATATNANSNFYAATPARPHKSMEFLLDKQNLRVVEPPENELQKSERVMSEHQLRVQRSLQKLNVPEWYKASQVPGQGFLLKKTYSPRWTGTCSSSSKTPSLSSLGSGVPSSPAFSPTTLTPHFVRWSTSKLNSTASSPCASTRSSFNARQPNGSVSPGSARSSFRQPPYLGWRSQERLSRPRTPAERLANSLLEARQDDAEIRTSIKEVTSAIVHYVSGLKPDARDEDTRSRSASPRGSQKLYWLESSFVGVKPLDSPQTPVTLTENQPQTTTTTPASNLRLELQTHNDMSLMSASLPKPSPGSTTLEDVLDSLLGLPPSDRAPSPSLQGRRHVDGVS